MEDDVVEEGRVCFFDGERHDEVVEYFGSFTDQVIPCGVWVFLGECFSVELSKFKEFFVGVGGEVCEGASDVVMPTSGYKVRDEDVSGLYSP